MKTRTVPVFLLLFVLGCYKAQDIDRPVQKTEFLMDTYCSIKVYPKKNQKKTDIEKAIGSAFARIREIDNKFDAFNEKSEVYRFNKYGTAITDPEIIKLIKIAGEVWEKSNKVFDITIYPLVDLWGFYNTDEKTKRRIPSESEILNAKKLTGYEKLFVKKDEVRPLKKGVAIDFGGIAKGYAVSEAARILKESGISSSIIDAGGDIYALGDKYEKDWQIGIKKPDNEELMQVVSVRNMSLVTSGDYQRYFEKDGKRYHHIIEPSVGRPAETGIRSITVVTPDNTLADAWSTALFILGKDRALETAGRMKDLDIFFITDTGDIKYTPGMKKYFRKEI